jgi:hypothetical protein
LQNKFCPKRHEIFSRKGAKSQRKAGLWGILIQELLILFALFAASRETAFPVYPGQDRRH